MDLRSQIAVIKAWLPLLVASVLLAAVAAYLVSMQLPQAYEAKATLVVGQSLSAVSPDYNQLLVSQKLSTTYARVATTRPVLESVIKQLGLTGTSDDLAKRVKVDTAQDSTLLTITVQDPDPARAAAIANALADALIAASPAIQGRQTEIQKSIDADLNATQGQIDSTQAQADSLLALPSRTALQDANLQTLQTQLATLRSTYATLLTFSSTNASNLLNVIEPAVPATAPVSPKIFFNVLIAAALGLVISAAIAFAAVQLDDRIRTGEDVHAIAGLGMVGAIERIQGERGGGESSRLAAMLFPRSGVSEAYRKLRTNVEYAAANTPIRTLLLTSAVAQEGRTLTAANLAVVFAQAGRQVLLVDADLRKPGVHIVFNLPNDHGLTTMLRGDKVGLDAVAHGTEQENLRILTTGPLPPNPAELLGSPQMRDVLENLKKGAGLVIFDGPALDSVTDSAIVSSLVDGTLLVIDAERTHKRDVIRGRESLARVGANILGVVLNRLPTRSRPDFAGYDAYLANRGQPTDESPEQAGA